MKQYSQSEIRFLALRTVGNFLVLSSIFVLFLTFGPVIRNELVYRVDKVKGINYVVESQASAQNKENFGDALKKDKDIRVLTPVDSDFGIIIPKIAANAKVIANVDASNYDIYMSALREGVAHAQGTRFPGQGGNVYLFAHSTDNFWNIGRYNAIFYLLKELDEGDEIDMFYKGVRYIYIVSGKKIVEPYEVSILNIPTDFEQLTLQTCWPPGTTYKRLVITAQPLSN